MTEERYKFIQPIRDKIVGQVPGAAEVANAAIDAWESGADPVGPYEAGVFEICDQVKANIQTFRS